MAYNNRPFSLRSYCPTLWGRVPAVERWRKGIVLGIAGGMVPGCQALKRLHPGDRLRLIMIDEPLLFRPILLSEFTQAQNPSRGPVLCQKLRVQPGRLEGPTGRAGAQGSALCG